MLISLNWIKDYVNLDGIEVDELVKRFGLSTAEVEGVEYKGKEIDQVVVAEILSVENHPESQKLHILKEKPANIIYNRDSALLTLGVLFVIIQFVIKVSFENTELM